MRTVELTDGVLARRDDKIEGIWWTLHKDGLVANDEIFQLVIGKPIRKVYHHDFKATGVWIYQNEAPWIMQVSRGMFRINDHHDLLPNMGLICTSSNTVEGRAMMDSSLIFVLTDNS